MAIYLDYAATTPVDRRVADKMMNYLTADGIFANPASHSHALGWQAEKAVDTARQQVAELINAKTKEIVWTSGATESDNLAIKGSAYFNRRKGRHIITSKTEHKAVLDTCHNLLKDGFTVTYLDPDADGSISLDTVKAAVRDDTILVSIMYVNNETGVINDIAAIGAFTREKGIVLHVDAAQAAGKIAIDVQADNIDLLSLTAHKIYGPKGIGALYVCRQPRMRLQAQIHGGGHERGMRSGTLPTHQIVGMGEAYRLAKQELAQDQAHAKLLATRLWSGLARLPAVYLNAADGKRIDNVLNVSFAFVDGEQLLRSIDDLAVSSGSACTSGNPEPSYVLQALGISEELSASSIRFSFGRMTTVDDIDQALASISTAVQKLRSLSPRWEMFCAGLGSDGNIQPQE